MINIHVINDFLKSFLDPDSISDVAINGIQIENDGEDIRRVAFAVDASLSSIEKAINDKCELLITHHGIFWGKVEPITGCHRKRIKTALENNLGLISYHLPLDANGECGNNIELSRKIGLINTTPFAKYKGNFIGYYGELEKALPIEMILDKLGVSVGINNVNYLAFGNNDIKKIAIVSGGAGDNIFDALTIKADLFITGDSYHELFHVALENKINVLFAGHYYTEIFGVKALQKKIEEKFGLYTVFCDIPTGL